MTLTSARREEWKHELRAERKVLLETRHRIEPRLREIDGILKSIFGEG